MVGHKGRCHDRVGILCEEDSVSLRLSALGVDVSSQ